MRTRPVAMGIFAGEGEETCLLAGRRKADGRLVFPLPSWGRSDQYEVIELGREGRLWSWTVQRFPPKEPYNGPVGENFRPYGVGYIELIGEIIVESRLVGVNFERLHIGMPMRLTTEIFRTEPDGIQILTHAFQPVPTT